MGMGFMLSPGVLVKEWDISTIVPQVATSGAAYVGAFEWGPVDKINTISSKKNLIRYYGLPSDETYLHWFSCANFLEYSRNLKAVRVIDKTVALNATTGTLGTLILNEDDWNDENAGGQTDSDCGSFAGRYPGLLGNNLGIYMTDSSTFGAVHSYEVVSQGTGYEDGDNVAVTVSAPHLAGGIQATAVATIAGGVMTIVPDEIGSGYKYPPIVTVAGPEDVQADATAVVDGSGDLTAINVDDGGFGYDPDDLPLITVTADPADVGTAVLPTGVTATVVGGEITAIAFTGGAGFVTAAPTVVIAGPTLEFELATAECDLWKYYDNFLTVPGTSNFTAKQGGSNDEMHIVVVDETGKVTGEQGEILERFSFVSKARDAKYDDGTSSYYVNVLRDASAYVFWLNHPDMMNNWGQPANGIDFTDIKTATLDDYSETFANAADGNNVSNNELLFGWDMFRNPENVDIGILISGSADRVLQEYLIQNIAEHRMDCVAVISPEQSDVVRNPRNELNDTIMLRDVLTSSSYGIFDCNWKYQFDMYNDTFRWIPCNPDVAGLMAHTDESRDPWWSPAGFNRGHIKNCVKLAWNPDHTDRDELYQNGINPIVTFKGEGTLLYGDKTMLTKPSAFDRINVRRLFIVLEKAISKASKYALFEFNDEFTRMRFVQIVEPFLRDVQGRRGIYDFKVVCDETNNTPYVIDSNAFVGDIYIKPARSINFITLNFVATPTGAEFSEIQGTFGDF